MRFDGSVELDMAQTLPAVLVSAMLPVNGPPVSSVTRMDDKTVPLGVVVGIDGAGVPNVMIGCCAKAA
jgi:hypothetical protein